MHCHLSQILLKSTFGQQRQKIHLQKARAVPDESQPQSVTYADAGVDIRSGNRTKERIKYLAQKTFNRNVLGGIGGFGAIATADINAGICVGHGFGLGIGFVRHGIRLSADGFLSASWRAEDRF